MKKMVLMALLILSLAVPATSFAQTAEEGYSGVAGVEETSGNGSGGGDPAGQPASAQVAGTDQAGGSLPFTGLDVGIVAGAGLLLLGTGLVLRKVRTN
jgi:hypothetical protein